MQLELNGGEDPGLTVQQTAGAESGCSIEGFQWVTEKFGNITRKNLHNFHEDIAEKRVYICSPAGEKKSNVFSPFGDALAYRGFWGRIHF